MKCPFCNNDDSQVRDSRSFNNRNAIKRRRECLSCGARFTTLETIQLKELKVIKKDGSYQAFSREKILRSIEIAMRKRATSNEKLNDLINNIICKLEKMEDAKITTKLIGRLILSQLAQIDQIACVRFASVYMNFSNSEDFTNIIKLINEEKDQENREWA